MIGPIHQKVMKDARLAIPLQKTVLINIIVIYGTMMGILLGNFLETET
jgi:hypothetical protein